MGASETPLTEDKQVREPLTFSRVLGNTLRGALCGALAAGIVGSLALASLLTFLTLGNDYLIVTGLLTLIISVMYATPAGFVMGLLVGLVDSLMRLGWRSSGFALELWCLIGLPLGALAGGLVGLILAWGANSTDTSGIVMSFVLGCFLGALGGPFAGPAFGYLYTGRLGRRLQRLRRPVRLQESQ
jgi:hypothetical protein